MTWAFGKAILLGEHAVVYGHPALAGAIDSTLHCTLTERDSSMPGMTLRVPSWNLSVSSQDDHLVARALRTVADALSASSLAADIAVDTALPAAAGLGSSAALCVALVRTLAQATEKELSDDDIVKLANDAERCFHNNPSGVDVALATRGGLGLYSRGQGIVPIHGPPIALAIGLSGQPRQTADMLARVAKERRRDRHTTDAHLAALGEAAQNGRDALVRGDLFELGGLMTSAHETLATLGVSAPVLDDLVLTALDSGALGAKLTGAGGGGAVIAVALGCEDQIVSAWRDKGYDALVCNLGAKS